MRGLRSYLDVEKRTRGDESLKAAAVEASRLAVVVKKRILSEVKRTDEVILVGVAPPVALGYSDNRQEPKMMMMLMMMEKLVAAAPSIQLPSAGSAQHKLQLGAAFACTPHPSRQCPELAHHVTKIQAALQLMFRGPFQTEK